MQRNTVADTAGISGRCRRSHTAAHPSTSGDLAVLPRLAGPRPLGPLFGLRGPNVSRRLALPLAVLDQLAGVVRRSRDGGGRTQVQALEPRG